LREREGIPFFAIVATTLARDGEEMRWWSCGGGSEVS
jgi:hypothetical protein